MATVKECVLVKTGKASQACARCKVDDTSVDRCALAAVTEQEARQLVVPPMGGPKFKEVRTRLGKQTADHMDALLKILKADGK